MDKIEFTKKRPGLTPAKNEEIGLEWGTPMTDNIGFLSVKDNEMQIAGKPYSYWVNEFKLPLHIMYAPILVRNLSLFKKVFDDHYSKGRIRFAGKVNPHPSVFKLVSKENVGADVVSLNTMNAALAGGIDPLNIDVNGNAKSDEIIDKAVKMNMFLIADSYEELQIINQRALNMDKKARVALRVAGFKMDNVTDANIFTAGVWSKFGENINNIPGIIKELGNFKGVDLYGFHTHIGSQISEASSYHTAVGRLIELGHMLNESGGSLRLLNIGGGFPFNYARKNEWEYVTERVSAGYKLTTDGDPSKTFVWHNELGGLGRNENGSINPDKWSGEKMYSDYPKETMLREVLTGSVPVNGKDIPLKKALEDLNKPELVIEPGRSIAEDSGITLAKVSHVRKVAGGHNLITVEAAVTNYATAMLLPPVNPWTVVNDPYHKDEKPFEAFVAGNLCYSGDIISKYKIFLQRKPKRGDILCCYYTGAYDPSFFPCNTNCFPRPARILTDENGLVSVIKSRDTYDEIFSLNEK